MMRKQLGALTARRAFGLCACWVVVGLALGGAQPAWADDDDIVNANGFEPTAPYGFSTTFIGTGQLEGQINPPGEGQAIPPGQWLRTKNVGASTAFVQNTVFAPGGGTQAVKVDRAANSDVRWAVPVNALGYPDYPNPAPPEPAQPCIFITLDMRVEHSLGNGDSTFGPFFGVEAYDDDGNPVGLLGSLGVDAATGEVLYQAAGSGFLTPTGSMVGFGQWNKFQMKLDYSTHQYSVLLNGSMLGTSGFVDQNNISGGLDQFSDADIAAVSAAGNAASLALTGTAYYDNFLVREGTCEVVPEPSTMAVVGVGLALFSGLRRRRSVK